MHDVQVKQIVIAAGETTEKVCMVTPRTRHLRGRAPRKLCTKLLLAWVTQVERDPDGDTCTVGCEPRVQRCNRQERETLRYIRNS